MKDKFEDIIQKKFEGASSPVPTEAWAGISSGMAGSAAGSVFSSVIVKGIIGLVVVGSVVTAVIINQPEPQVVSEATPTENTQTQSEEKTSTTKESSSDLEKTQKSLSNEPLEIAETPINRTISSEDEESAGLVENESAKGENTQPNSDILETLELIPEENDSAPHESELENTDGETPLNPTSSQVNEHNEEEILLPSAILSNYISAYSYSFKLNQSLSKDIEVKWYIDDAPISVHNQFDYEFSGPGEYTVLASIYKNGKLEDTLIQSVSVRAQPKLNVPNTFTPNASISLNDTFDIDHNSSEYIEDYVIEVYAVNGELVFQSTGNNKAWNGQFNGSPAEEGIYTYKIIYWGPDGVPKTELGNVVLQR